MKLLFVCTGNTCRSPMAMAVMGRLLDKSGRTDIIVDSAGLAAYGEGVAENALIAVGEWDAEARRLDGYRSKPVTAELADEADKVIAMTDVHAAALISAGTAPEKVMVLGGGIPDPYGGDLEVYRHTLRLMCTELEKLIALL